MPKTYIKRSILIDAPSEKVFPLINNFENWTAWSPWAILEKESKVSVAEGGKYFNWVGNRIGEGEMKITSEESNKTVNADLTFLKPWKSHAKIDYTLNEKDGGTEISWEMHSKLPFFMFWMKTMMQNMVGMDFERGLKMLKDLVEKEHVPCKLEHEANTNFEGTSYIGFTNTCSMAKIGNDMSEKIPQLKTFIRENKLEANEEILSIYHKWDLKNKAATYTIGAIVKSAPDSLPNGMTKGSIGKGKVNLVRHTGSYDHLANAWSMQMMMQRNKEFKQNKKQPPFEIYKNSPFNTAEEELVTEVMFPLVD